MKFYETHFDEYIKIMDSNPIMPIKSLNNICLYESVDLMNNLIIYGPVGIGKYSQALKIIKHYSPLNLKYEKKITLLFNKAPFYFRISDIHYEIDMSLLGCNSKQLWHEIYGFITDIIVSKKNKTGIILCKYFNDIHNELLEIFYSYMQKLYTSGVIIKFILITQDISFIPDNILNCCKIIKFIKPSKSIYNKHLNMKSTNYMDINNIKDYKTITSLCNEYNNSNLDISQFPIKLDSSINIAYKQICDEIISNILNIDKLKYNVIREHLYDICIFDLNIHNCILYIIQVLIDKKKINNKQLNTILLETFNFSKLYNNNYRPIYHLERYILYITAVVHELL